MKRVIVLGTLVGVGVLSMVVSGQVPAGPSAEAIAATKIEKVKDNLYVITGSGAEDMTSFSGGNTAVFVTDTGVTLVDTKLPGWGPTIVERVKSVTNKPITRIINTHTHGDHTGNNGFFGAVESVVQENAKASMANMDSFKGANAKFLPTRTYKDRLTLGSGRDQIDLYHFGPGHTNGDTFVVFPAQRTMHVGDMFAWKALPYVDPTNGGSLVQQPASLARAVEATAKSVDTIINGHIPVAPFSDLREYVEFTKDFVAFAQASIKAGKTADQAAADYVVPARFKGYKASVNGQFGGPKPNMQIAYNELTKK
jgi:cyclase